MTPEGWEIIKRQRKSIREEIATLKAELDQVRLEGEIAFFHKFYCPDLPIETAEWIYLGAFSEQELARLTELQLLDPERYRAEMIEKRLYLERTVKEFFKNLYEVK